MKPAGSISFHSPHTCVSGLTCKWLHTFPPFIKPVGMKTKLHYTLNVTLGVSIGCVLLRTCVVFSSVFSFSLLYFIIERVVSFHLDGANNFTIKSLIEEVGQGIVCFVKVGRHVDL